MKLNRPVIISSLFFCLFGMSFVSFAQDAPVTDDEKPDWSCRDTTKFTSTGFIGVNIGIEPVNGINLIGAFPVNKSHFGLCGKIGYGREDNYYSQSHFVNDMYAMVGGYLTFQLNTHYAFDIRLLAGFVYSPYPVVNYQDSISYGYQKGSNTTDSTVHSNYTIQGTNAFSIAFQGGIGFRYMIGGNVGLQLNVDYSFRASVLQQISSVQTFSSALTTTASNSAGTRTNYNLPPDPISRTVDHKDTSGFAIISFGIYYQLGTAVLKQ